MQHTTFSRIFVGLMAMLLCIHPLVACNTSHEPDPYQTVGEIAGQPVALGELQLFVDDVRQQTNSYFKKNYSLDAITEEEWRKDFSGESPVDYAIGLAMEELVPYKVVEQKLVELGSSEDFSYRAFVNRWQKENEDRQQKEASGEVIYGPVQYTERVYYDYLNESYQEELAAQLRQEPTEEELQAFYDDNPDLFQEFGSVTLQCVVLPQEDFSQEQGEEARNILLQALEAGATFADASVQAGIDEYTQERTFTAEDLSSPDVRAFPDVEDAVYTLQPGDTTDLIQNGDLEWLFFYCETRQEGGRTPFAECRDALEEIYVEQAFDMSLEQAQSSAQIIIYDQARELID